MLNRKPLAAALAALALAYAGHAAAQTDVLVVEGTSVGIAAAGNAPAGGRNDQIDVLSFHWGATAPAAPVGQKVREAAARTERELTPAERAASVGANRTATVGGGRTETVTTVPLTPLDDVTLKGQKILQNAPGPQAHKYMEIRMEEAIISSVRPGGAAAAPKGHEKWIELQSWSAPRAQPGLSATPAGRGSPTGDARRMAPQLKPEALPARTAR